MKLAVTLVALDQELLAFYENENIFIKETDEYFFLRPLISKKYFITHRSLTPLGEPIYRNFEIFDVDSFQKTENLECGPLHDKFMFTPKKSPLNFVSKPLKKCLLHMLSSTENYENDDAEDDERADYLLKILERSRKKFSFFVDRYEEKFQDAVLIILNQYCSLKEMKETNDLPENQFRKKSFNEFNDREKNTSIPPTKRHLKRQINAKKRQDRKVFAEAAKICFEKIATQALIQAIKMSEKIREQTNKKKALFVGTILKEIDASSRLFFTAFLNDDDLILEKKDKMKVLKPKKNARKQVVEKQEEQVVEKQEEKHEENKQHECVICLCSISNIACVPCGHLVMCSKCHEDENNSLKECPLCRKEISLMVKIFI